MWDCVSWQMSLRWMWSLCFDCHFKLFVDLSIQMFSMTGCWLNKLWQVLSFTAGRSSRIHCSLGRNETCNMLYSYRACVTQTIHFIINHSFNCWRQLAYLPIRENCRGSLLRGTGFDTVFEGLLVVGPAVVVVGPTVVVVGPTVVVVGSVVVVVRYP